MIALHAGEPVHGRVKLSDVELYYEISGSGPYLVLIEGLGVATWIWERQIPELSRDFTVVAYDNRGVGKSGMPPGPYSIRMMADDLAGLLDSLRIARAHILGISMGGFIAQDFALRYPARVDRLVLVATSAGGPDHVPMAPEVLAQMLATEGEPRELTRRKLALAYSEAFMQSEVVEHLIDLRLREPQPRAAYLAQAAAGATFNLSGQVHLIQAPCLIMAATGDRLVPVANAYNLAKKIPNSRLKIFEGLGHQFFVEEAPAFNRAVKEFLQAAVPAPR
ncbi:MAG: alpha/beta hydrolase [candidate division KSB1 bacterium]|nr:alpha/beta hydrolase [candidate division KSB1 bacterium]MDZ7275668.1 alpha/beta hydrolase [candidate division KSB1 bacterium]MDZ7297940.1 alpha/beta hydrolase [candidate division KSB1 bacterium]MDZ7309563.1 alpha/beta hydrolase [candidate division KSB1 bacterium]MDZ7348805.1 alpha/beta hydrolase [candidate division KSB1 bacterium]